MIMLIKTYCISLFLRNHKLIYKCLILFDYIVTLHNVLDRDPLLSWLLWFLLFPGPLQERLQPGSTAAAVLQISLQGT